MIADAECVRVISEILSELQLGNFLVKVCVYIYIYTLHLLYNCL